MKILSSKLKCFIDTTRLRGIKAEVMAIEEHSLFLELLRNQYIKLIKLKISHTLEKDLLKK